MKCEETEEEKPSNNTEKFYQLSCFIEKGKVMFICSRAMTKAIVCYVSTTYLFHCYMSKF